MLHRDNRETTNYLIIYHALYLYYFNTGTYQVLQGYAVVF